MYTKKQIDLVYRKRDKSKDETPTRIVTLSSVSLPTHNALLYMYRTRQGVATNQTMTPDSERGVMYFTAIMSRVHVHISS